MKQLTAFLLCLASLTAFGQHTQNHHVPFSDIDGFSGYVDFTSSREGFATQLRGKDATLTITNYKCTSEEKTALTKAGLNLWSSFHPETFGVVVEGRAYVQMVSSSYKHYQNGTCKLQLNNGLGGTTAPTFDEVEQKEASEYRKKHGTSFWEDLGGFEEKEVTTLYLSDLKTEIQGILYAAKKEKQKAEQKEKEEKAEKEKQEAEAQKEEASSSTASSSNNGNEDRDKNDTRTASETTPSSERGSVSHQPRQQSNHEENIRKYNAINRQIANVDKAHNEFNNAIDQVSEQLQEKARADQQSSKDWWENEKAEAAKIREEKQQRDLEWEQNKENERRKEEEDLNRRNDIMREKIAQSKPGAYDYMENFSEEGLAKVAITVDKVGRKYGFIDKTGKEIVPLKYDGASFFSEGLAMVSVGDAYRAKTKKGFIDKTGREIVPIKYDDAGSFSEGLAYVKINNKYGFIDKNGNTVIPFDNNNVYSFSEGLAWVYLFSWTDKNKRGYGFIDKSGNEVIPFKYESIFKNSFSEGLARVKLNDKYGFIDKTGKEVIPLKYDNAEGFSDGLAKVELNDKYYFIDKTGKEVIPLEYDYAWSFSEGLALVELNDKAGFIDKTGQEIIALKYDEAYDFSDGLALVKLNGKYGFINKAGEEVIPLEYEYANSFKNGTTIVKLNGVFYSIDKTGKKAAGN